MGVFVVRMFHIWTLILQYFVFIKLATSYKYSFRFKENENCEILFFSEKQKEKLFEVRTDDDLKYKLIYEFGSDFREEKNIIFTYRKENFIQLELLNNFLLQSTSENKSRYGVIECNFNLSYFLKLTKDITGILYKLENHEFRCLLTMFECFKVVEDTNFVKFLQALNFIEFFDRKIPLLRNINLDYKQIISSGFNKEASSNLRKNLLSAFLNNFMMKFIFYDGNLILLENPDEIYDISLFDEHIPYKNLLINNYKVFCILDNLFKNSRGLNTFQVLLNELNIKSVIINNYLVSGVPDINFRFCIFSITIFKSLVLSDFICTSTPFLSKINVIVENKIEYLGLKNIFVFKNDLIFFLKKRNLKGLVLHNVTTIDIINSVSDYINPDKTLEYIDFKKIGVYFSWWYDLFNNTCIDKIILSFNSLLTQENFVKEFTRYKFYEKILHFEVKFHASKISGSFWDSLYAFKSLHTLKLRGFKHEEKNDCIILKAIEQMKDLEQLCISLCVTDKISYNVLFQKSKIKILHLESVFQSSKTLEINFCENYKSIIKLFLKNIMISSFSLNEIFKLENLEVLCLNSCIIESIIDAKTLNFLPKNIKILDFQTTDLSVINDVDVLSKLDHLVKLDLSKCNLPSGYLAKLSLICSSKLKSLYYILGILDLNDINRIEYFEILEELNLSQCKFINSSFLKLGDNCKFFNSLKILELLLSEINIEDLDYLKKFKSLKKLKLQIMFFNLDVLDVKNRLICLSISQFSTNIFSEVSVCKTLSSYLEEVNINVYFYGIHAF